MTLLGSQTLTLIEPTGKWSAGIWTPVGDSTSTIRGSIQPLTNREVDLLPEGERWQDTRKLYTRATLRVVDVDNELPPHRIQFDGREWEVHGDQYYDTPTGRGLWHHRYRLKAIAPEEIPA